MTEILWIYTVHMYTCMHDMFTCVHVQYMSWPTNQIGEYKLATNAKIHLDKL